MDAFGGRASSCEYPLTAAEARTGCLHGAYTSALALGKALEDADDPIAGLLGDFGARRLMAGKLVDIDQRTRRGFTVGFAEVDGTGADAGLRATVEFQNENLLVRRGETILAAVPDIIAMLDSESGRGAAHGAAALRTARDRPGPARPRGLAHPGRAGAGRPAGVRLRLRLRAGGGMSAHLRIGVDVGGTNTDAVLIGADGGLLSKVKTPTTTDVATGIRTAIGDLVDASGGQAAAARWVMVGSTAATNAVLERRGLDRVAILRIGDPSATIVRPLFDWPAELYAAVVSGAEIVGGGAEYDGRPIAPLDVDAVRRFAHRHAPDADAIAVCGVFANVADDQEHRSRRGDPRRGGRRRCGSASAPRSRRSACSSARAPPRSTRRWRRSCGRSPPPSRLRSTSSASARRCSSPRTTARLSSMAELERRPILTVGSGPANSIRGAPRC